MTNALTSIRLRTVLIVMALALMLASRPSPAQQVIGTEQEQAAAVAVVGQLIDALVEAAQFDDSEARLATLHDVVVSSHDLTYIAELSVRRQWRDWDETQRREFVDAFSQLSVMTYAARFANVSAQSFAQSGSESAGSAGIQVRTSVLRNDGTQVPLDFVLRRDASAGWRIVNVIADGVSDLALKRAEYRRTIDESGFAGLIEDLRSQTRELANSARN